jgi:hypothetical protein
MPFLALKRLLQKTASVFTIDEKLFPAWIQDKGLRALSSKVISATTRALRSPNYRMSGDLKSDGVEYENGISQREGVNAPLFVPACDQHDRQFTPNSGEKR